MTDEQLEKRLDFIEFRQDLLFDNDEVSRIIYEAKITREEYQAIMDLMDKIRAWISNGLEVNNSDYEEHFYEIVPEHHGDYHLCENIAQAFMEEGRWEEVFPALYGDMPKYSYLKKKR